ncbi:MAG TPA: hypothetical protein VE934_01760 [Polaromonas sp.]|uniref:hypothetical protein n=1 Tax=Polaromonas sp. TaxID=1869339 RepID=UPI002D33AA99|nr:hypothetical protein [Polaromonas sp.]HYW55661.1 hypothetical protein [Polaromonas sp.]
MDVHQTLPENLPALLEGRFEGRAEFGALIRQAFATAASQGWREIIMCDNNFEDWPLGERVVMQTLNDWSKTGRKLTVLAQNYDEITRRHARFVTWRRTWTHIVDCRRCAAGDLPSALWSAGWVFERLDIVRSTGVACAGSARRVALKERLEEKLLRSTPSFAATTLGL